MRHLICIVGVGAAAAFTTPMLPTRTPARANIAMMEQQTRREAFLGLAAAATLANIPRAAHAGAREDGIALLRKQAKNPPPAKGGVRAKPYKKGSYKLYNGPPKGSGADKCQVSKACTTGAGLKWDPKALGVEKGATTPDGKNPRNFFKTPTCAPQFACTHPRTPLLRLYTWPAELLLATVSLRVFRRRRLAKVGASPDQPSA